MTVRKPFSVGLLIVAVTLRASAEAPTPATVLRRTLDVMELGLPIDCNPPQFDVEHVHAQIRVLSGQPASKPFVRAWFLAVMAYDLGRDAFHLALECWESAPEGLRLEAEMQLALGAIHEDAWQATHQDGRAVGFAPSLDVAERAYRAATVATDSSESHIRLGRVLTLEKKYDLAEAVLTSAIDDQGGARYLALLFHGDLLMRRGDFDGASRALHAAEQMLPAAASAQMALADLELRQGRVTDAARRVTTSASAVTDAGDPWYWYYKGIAWRTEGYVNAMRDAAR